ncbi:MAG: thiamine diphosphokinase [Oscillospiraceae bacterium]
MKKATCCIVGAGFFDPDEFLPEGGDYIIAADGGLSPLRSLGVMPDLVVGDFDSLGHVPDHPNIIKHPVEKDDTDMMLAVKTGLQLGFSRFVIYGGLGGRLDHTLANIQTLEHIAINGGRGYLVGGGTVITAVTDGCVNFVPKESGGISVFSGGDRADGVYLTGLKYPLVNAALTSSIPLGVSNKFTGVRSTVSVKSGTLIVMWQGGLDDVERPVLSGFDGAIFDMDGTLLDSMPIWNDLGKKYLLSMGITPRPDLRERLRSLSLLQTAEYFSSDYGLMLSADEIMDGINSMLESFYRFDAPAKPGVKEFLEGLRQKGVKLCIATATDRCLVEPALKRTGLFEFFDTILTCTEVGSGKDEPEIFLQAANALGTPVSTTYVFEDAYYAAKTVKAAGFPLVVCYDESADKRRAALNALADKRIATFLEL